MALVNRGVMIVRAKDGFARWAARALGESIESVRDELAKHEPSIYLIPDYDDGNGIPLDFLQSVYEDVFERELEGWCTDERIWPPIRTFTMFADWFELEYASMVVDLVDGALSHEPE